jgi:hypothetical protein
VINITFSENPAWRAAVTDVQVNGVSVGTGKWNLNTAGNLILDPAQVTALQTAGNKTIKVIATGYQDAIVTQTLSVGTFNEVQSSKVLVSGIENVGGTPVYELTARDQFGNPIENYQFGLKLEALNDNHAHDEKVTVQINQGAVTEYTLPQTSGTPVLVTINEINGVTTSAQGKITVTLHYFNNGVLGTDYDLNDYAAPVWYDTAGNKIF